MYFFAPSRQTRRDAIIRQDMYQKFDNELGQILKTRIRQNIFENPNLMTPEDGNTEIGKIFQTRIRQTWLKSNLKSNNTRRRQDRTRPNQGD